MKYHDENDIDKIDKNVWLGNHEGANNYNLLKKNNINIVINFYEIHPQKYKNITYYHIPFKYNKINIDNSWKLIKILKKIFDEHKNENILLCCKAGHHRSANSAVVYLINKYKWDYNKASKHIRNIRRHALDRESNMSSAVRIYGKVIHKIYN